MLKRVEKLHCLSPPYISELITVKPKSTYSLRSNNSTLLLPATHKMLPTLDTRSFAAAPAHWNRLPAAIRNVASLNIVLRNQSGPSFLTNHFKFYFLLFLHSILYLILYEIFVKRF